MTSIGFPIEDRTLLDTAEFWTMVSKKPFSADGAVKSFEMFVGGTARAFRFGIYRPTGTTCEFKLLQQKEWSGFGEGHIKVRPASI